MWIIGLANIIPGVSGETMAVSMGIYDKVIHCISHFFSELKKNIAFLAPLVLGIGIAIIASSFGIDYLFETFPVQTNLLFIGLILGSFDLTIIEIQKQEILLATPIDKMNLTKRIQLERDTGYQCVFYLKKANWYSKNGVKEFRRKILLGKVLLTICTESLGVKR